MPVLTAITQIALYLILSCIGLLALMLAALACVLALAAFGLFSAIGATLKWWDGK